MRALANLDIRGEFAGSFKSFDKLPENPRAGQWALIGNRVSVCVEIEEGNLPVWFPITNVGNQFEHEQKSDLQVWDIKHDLGSETVMVQCFDVDSIPMRPDEIEVIDENNVRVSFSAPIQGRAFVLYGCENGIDIEARSYDNVTKEVGALKFESINANKSLKTFFGKLTNGQLISWGYSDYYSTGQGNSGVAEETGFTILALPYTTNEVIQYGCNHLTAFALMDNGDLYTWGDNRSGQCGHGHKSNVYVPTLALSGVEEVLHQNYTVRDWASDERYMIAKMRDGSIMIAGFTGETTWTEVQDSSSFQLMRLPDGVAYEDIRFTHFEGYGGRRAFFIQTKSLDVYASGRNYHGNLGTSSKIKTEESVPWTLIPELSGKQIEKICSQHGWLDSRGKSPNGYSTTYVLTSDREMYHAGQGYPSGKLYLTGYITDENPVNSDNYMTFTLIQTEVDYMQTIGSPVVMLFKKGGQWWGFGHSGSNYRLHSTSTENTMETQSLAEIPIDAKVVEHWTCYTETWRQPTAFYDDQFIYLRGENNYGCMGLGDTTVRKEYVKVDHTAIFDGKIKQIAFHGYSVGDSCLALTERGSLYAVGYGGRGLYYLDLGNFTDNYNASNSLWQLIGL